MDAAGEPPATEDAPVAAAHQPAAQPELSRSSSASHSRPASAPRAAAEDRQLEDAVIAVVEQATAGAVAGADGATATADAAARPEAAAASAPAYRQSVDVPVSGQIKSGVVAAATEGPHAEQESSPQEQAASVPSSKLPVRKSKTEKSKIPTPVRQEPGMLKPIHQDEGAPSEPPVEKRTSEQHWQAIKELEKKKLALKKKRMTEDMRKIEEWQITAEALKKKHEEDKERKRQEVMERIREREKQRLEEQRIRKEKEEAVLQAIGEVQKSRQEFEKQFFTPLPPIEARRRKYKEPSSTQAAASAEASTSSAQVARPPKRSDAGFKPLFARLEEQFKAREAAEQEKVRQVITKMRERYRPPDYDEMKAREKEILERLELAERQKRLEREAKQREEMERAPGMNVYKGRTRAKVEQEIEERKKLQREQEEAVRLRLERKQQYAKLVREVFVAKHSEHDQEHDGPSSRAVRAERNGNREHRHKSKKHNHQHRSRSLSRSSRSSASGDRLPTIIKKGKKESRDKIPTKRQEASSSWHHHEVLPPIDNRNAMVLRPLSDTAVQRQNDRYGQSLTRKLPAEDFVDGQIVGRESTLPQRSLKSREDIPPAPNDLESAVQHFVIENLLRDVEKELCMPSGSGSSDRSKQVSASESESEDVFESSEFTDSSRSSSSHRAGDPNILLKQGRAGPRGRQRHPSPKPPQKKKPRPPKLEQLQLVKKEAEQPEPEKRRPKKPRPPVFDRPKRPKQEVSARVNDHPPTKRQLLAKIKQEMRGREEFSNPIDLSADDGLLDEDGDLDSYIAAFRTKIAVLQSQ